MKKEFPGEYPSDWDKIATAVKDAAEWRCVRCGHKHDRESGHVLTVHHLDRHKDNCAWWNLPALCQRCHLHIQGKVIMEQPFLLATTYLTYKRSDE
jgi:5-methylcytosine-specific restriction endonuclease McrA